jgi:hypothetical protein
MKSVIIFQGKATICLEGDNALSVAVPGTDERIEYYLGAPETNIRVIDYRKNTNQAALKALKSRKPNRLVDAINQPAKVQVLEDPDGMVVSLEECTDKGEFPTLWLGVSQNGWLKARRVAWDIMRPLGQAGLAFAALVP